MVELDTLMSTNVASPLWPSNKQNNINAVNVQLVLDRLEIYKQQQ